MYMIGSLYYLPFSIFRLPNLFTTFMFVPRLCRPRAHREDASAEPPQSMTINSRFGYTFFAVLCALALMLPHSVWAAGAAAPTAVAAAPTALNVGLLMFFVVLAIGVSFACSLAESVLLSMTPSFIADVQETNPKKADMLKSLKVDNIDQSLAAILTLNTVAHTLGSIGAGAQATIVFGSAWFGLFSAIMTLAILVLSEIIPKTIGATYWKKFVPFTVISLRLIILVLYPVVKISQYLTSFLKSDVSGSVFSRSEFLHMTKIGEREGVFEKHESLLISNLLKFNSVCAKDIMTESPFVLDPDDTIGLAADWCLANKFHAVHDGHVHIGNDHVDFFFCQNI